MFENRTEAGRLLARELGFLRKQQGVILAVPRGGVPVAYEVATALQWPMELMLVKKIGHPNNKEYAIGAVSLTDSMVIPHESVSDAYIDREILAVRNRLQEMKRKFMGDREPRDLKGRTVLVIDDGVATGNTLLALLRTLRKAEPAKLLIAAPVASQEAFEKLQREADELFVLDVPEYFRGVGAFYQEFTQVSDETVQHYLDDLKAHALA
ncbi:phosphoribosyltransferase [Flaviaesturariibacter terrae]